MSYISAWQTGDQVRVWERTEFGRTYKDYLPQYYFYVEDPNGKYTSIFKDKLSKVICKDKEDFEAVVADYKDRGIRLYESDIAVELKVLSRFYKDQPAPKLHVTLLDIEVDYSPVEYTADRPVRMRLRNSDDVTETTLTVGELRVMHDVYKYEVWDDYLKRWCMAEYSTAMYQGPSGYSSTMNPYAPINAIACHHYWKNESVVYVVPPPDFDMNTFDRSLKKLTKIVFCKDETELLTKFLKAIEDTDVLSGWNSEWYDLPMIALRVQTVLGSAARRKLDFPEVSGPRAAQIVDKENFGRLQKGFSAVGMITWDYLALFKKYEMEKRATYKLEAIAEEILPELPKLKYDGSLAQLYRNDFNHFLRYNIRDTEILKGFEDKLGYIDTANMMYHSAMARSRDVLGTVRMVDTSVIEFCHNVLNVKVPDYEAKLDGSIEGATVLFPQRGKHKRLGSIDIGSLYPSGIRSCNISPETLIGQFDGNAQAWHEIVNKTNTLLTLKFEDGDVQTFEARQWYKLLRASKWAVSGFGTVFDQNYQGVIPALLTDWYAKRKQYQKLKLAAGDAKVAITKKYENITEPDDVNTTLRYGMYMPESVARDWDAAVQAYQFNDRLQYVFKIKLNSTYGGLTNYKFRFFDLRLGESTTATGRMILRHQLRKAAEYLDGDYNVDFPTYGTVAEAFEKGMPAEVALEGPKFNGKFQSKSIIYGDTDSAYFLTNAATNEEAIIVADTVAKYVNDSFQEFMSTHFLCQPGYDNLIKAGREVVSDCGIFVNKKRYVLHLIDLDGYKVDKLKVMGLEMRKTTTPKPVQDFLKDVVSMILKDENWDVVNRFIIDYRDNFIANMDLLDLGLPKGCNELDKYTELFEENDAHRLSVMKDSSFKKHRIPGQVTAAIHYNKCLELYNDKENDVITSGGKVKVFYLERPSGVFKNIALPIDADYIPDWFKQDFDIDRKLHAEKLIDANLGHIFDAIGLVVPTRNTLNIERVFSY